MPDRNKRGFFTVDKLRAGAIDQYAVKHGDTTYSVALGMDPNHPPAPFYVKMMTSGPAGLDVLRLTFAKAGYARVRFNQRVRAIKKIPTVGIRKD